MPITNRTRETARLAYIAQLPPKFGNTNWEAKGGKLFTISPATFLAASKRLEPEVGSQNRIDALKVKIKQGEKIDPPALFVKDGKVVRHDGRHRATAALQLEIHSIPVLLIPVDGSELTTKVVGQRGNRIDLLTGEKF